MPAVITPMQRARWAPLLCLLPLAVTAIYDEDPLLEEARKSGNLAPLAAARHARALEIDSHNDPALAMLRSAVRMKPDVANYWNDLGLMELRGGAHTKAVSRFRRALAVDPSHAEARRNMRVVRNFYWDPNTSMEHDLPQDHLEVAIEHKVANLTRVAVEDLAKPENFDFLHGIRPHIVTGAATAERGYNATWWRLRELGRRFASSLTDFYPQGMNGHGTKTQVDFTAVPQAAEQLLAAPFEKIYEGWDASLNNAYIQWNIGMPDWRQMESQLGFLPRLMSSDFDWLEKCWDNDAHRTKYLKDQHWRILIAGQRGAGMFNHKDTLRSSSWQMAMQGPKRLQLCPPESDPFIYQAGDLDTFSPDYVKFPRARNLTCFWAELQAGDILYYPRDWWHHTKNMAQPTVALTGTLVTPENYDSMTEQLIMTYMQESYRIFDREKSTPDAGVVCHENGGDTSFCEGMLNCFDRWARTFGRTHFGKQPLDDAQIAAQREKAGGLVMARKAAIPMNRPYAEALTQPIEALNRQLVLGDLNQKQYEEELRSVMSIHGCPYENGLWRCRDHRSDNAGTTTVDDDE